ncbi:MAG TPA: right-handed parallel beta-helix repeat-containing protein [bacterium]|nr:right-handed parallel beta-helix repeat-containing protein [bacterium]
MLRIVFLLLFFISCSVEKPVPESDHENRDDSELQCGNYEVTVETPVMPSVPEIDELQHYSKEMVNCVQLAEITEEKMVLEEGCYQGCLTVSGKLSITGKGSTKTVIFCDDDNAGAVIDIKENSEVNIDNVTLSGLTRGVLVEKESTVFINETVISDCVKGGINVCGGEYECGSELFFERSRIENIVPEKQTEISYGISMGPGRVTIKDSVMSGFNSFGVALWGGNEGQSIVAEIENTVISDVYGGNEIFEGHAVYAEGGTVLSIAESKINDSSATFIYFSSDMAGGVLNMSDVTLENIIKTEKEQGGIVLDGRMSAQMERIYIKNSRGNGIFLNGTEITANDITIDSVFSDGFGNNGSGMMLFDGSDSEFNRISIKNSQTAGILMDGICFVKIENFTISQTRSDSSIFEFGVGAAVQEGAELIMESGIIDGNRECGVMAVNGKVDMNNVEIKNTMPRECYELNSCQFAPGVPFGHGISLYQGSELVLGKISISSNNNGLNIENSEVVRTGGEKAIFIKNISAVNAWNISSYKDLEKSLTDSEYCENQSVFTTDVQPVREGI